MKLLIVGSRSIKNFDISPFIPENVDLIITGGANGIDRIAEEYADKMKISKLILRPQYSHYKRAAPIIRNNLMVDICDEIIAFWDGSSRGTKHTINYAEKTGIPVKTITLYT